MRVFQKYKTLRKKFPYKYKIIKFIILLNFWYKTLGLPKYYGMYEFHCWFGLIGPGIHIQSQIQQILMN